MGSSRRVLVVGFPGAEMLDIACPTDVFDAVNRYGAEPGYDIELSSMAGELRCQNGISLRSSRLTDIDGPLDTMIVAGGVGHESAAADPEVLGQVRRLASASRRVASVCTGATVLARAGLLAGRRVTTHWADAERLAEAHPELIVDPKPLYIKDGRVYTAAGVTSGLDLALSLVDEDHGPAMARRVARALVTYVQRPGDQAQISMFVAGRGSEHRVLADLTCLIANRPGADLSTPALAARAGVGERQLTRLFLSHLGTTPGRYVRSARAEAAAQLMATALPLASVADRSGFGSAAAMRRAFAERFDTTPSQYRKRLTSPPPDNHSLTATGGPMFASAASELVQAIMAKHSAGSDSAGHPPDKETLFATVNTALTIAVSRRFPADVPKTEITDFALTVRQRFSDENMGAAILIEGVIRAALGEHRILDGLREDRALPVKLLTAHAIIKDLNLDDRQYDQLIDEIVRESRS